MNKVETDKKENKEANALTAEQTRAALESIKRKTVEDCSKEVHKVLTTYRCRLIPTVVIRNSIISSDIVIEPIL